MVYWSLYRLARHYSPPLARRASWHWYLLQAARTAAAMWKFGGRGTGTSQWGLMVGSAFQRVLSDLEREVQAAGAAAASALNASGLNASSEQPNLADLEDALDVMRRHVCSARMPTNKTG